MRRNTHTPAATPDKDKNETPGYKPYSRSVHHTESILYGQHRIVKNICTKMQPIFPFSGHTAQ